MSTIAVPRIVPQIPVRRAGRVRHVPEVSIDGLTPVAAQIVMARSHGRRAELVLRTPDAVVLQHGEDIADACRAVRFEAGANFIGYRLLALHATRQPDGELPEGHRKSLTIWRNGLAALAGSEASR